jgi:molecular chaperone GrpE
MKRQKQNVENREELNESSKKSKETNSSEPVQTSDSCNTMDEKADQLVDELKVMSQKCSELNDKNLRLMAEFDNYRKRALKERMDLFKTAGEKILVDMLPLIDDFERGLKAMETTEDVEALKEGIELIYSKFIAFLLQNGVKAIPTENLPFDTEFHEAIITFPAPTEDMKGKIIDCVSKGYTLNGKVIRFSKVVVGE